MKNRMILFLCGIAFLASCSSKSDNRVKINLAGDLSGVPVNNDFTLNDIVDDISFLQLEENDSLGSVYPYLWSVNGNGDYCCVDFGNKMTISIYNKEGKIISTFNNTGKGPTEYLYPASVFFDGNDEVTLLASMEKTLFKYDKNGKMISKITVPAIIDANDLGGGRYLSRTSLSEKGEWQNQLVIFDADGNVQDKFLPIDTTLSKDWSLYNAMVTKGDGGYNFSIQTFSKSAYYNYNIKKNEVTEWCEFDLGEYGLKADSKIANQDDYYKNYITTLDLSKAGNYLILAFVYNYKRFSDIWNLKTGELIARRVQPFGSNEGASKYKYQLPNGKVIELSLYPSITHNGVLIHTVNPSVLADAGVEGINPEGNLILLKMTLKK